VKRAIRLDALAVMGVGIACLLAIPVFYAPGQVIYVGGDPERPITTGLLALCCWALIVGGFGYQMYSIIRVAQQRWHERVRIGKRALGPLIEALRLGTTARTRKEAAEELGNFGDRLAVEALRAALNDESLLTRQAAAASLAKVGWAPPCSTAGAAFWAAKGEWAERVQIGVSAVEPLIRVLKGDSSDRRAAAAKALGEIGDKRAVPGLEAALHSSYYRLREAAAEALGRLGSA
jgi:hypothetical protein